jgi:hypothetical protein
VINDDMRIIDGEKILLGTGDDGEIYSSSDDLYICNVTQDKDIKLQVNDGGSTVDLVFLDGSAGKVGINTTAPAEKLHVVHEGQTTILVDSVDSSATTPARLVMRKARGTVGAEAAIQNGDEIATIGIAGYDGAAYDAYRKSIVWKATESWSAGNEGFDMHFWTRPNGSGGGPTERMAILNDGKVGVGMTPVLPFQVYHATTNTTLAAKSGDSECLIRAEDNAGWVMFGCLGDHMIFKPAGTEKARLESGGHFGVGTTNPSQIIDANDGSGNMIADGYDNHPSFLAKKVDPVPMSNVLAKFKRVVPYQYKRTPFVSADELYLAAVEEFGLERLEAVFPDGYRGGKLKNCPDPEILAFLDDLGDSLRAERKELPKWKRLHYSLAVVSTFPDVLTYNDDGDIAGYSLSSYVGLLHACVSEMAKKIEQLESIQ